MTRTTLFGLMSVLVLWGLSASASSKRLDYYHREVYFESGHDVCGGKAVLVFRGSEAILYPEFSNCSFLTLRHDGVIWRQSLIEPEYHLEINRVYAGLFTVSPGGIAGDRLEIDTAIPTLAPPPPPPPPPSAGARYRVIEVFPNRGLVVIPECGGTVFVSAGFYKSTVIFEGVGQCHVVQVKNSRYEPLSAPLFLSGPTYNYFGEFDASKYGLEHVVYELTSTNGGHGADIIVHVH